MIVERPESPPRHAGPAEPGRAPPVRPWLRACLAALLAVALLVPLRGFWAAQVLLVPLLLVVPGVILLRALRVPGRAVASFPLYVPSASLVVLFVSGIAVDLAGLLARDSTPLRPVPLLAGFEIVCLALLAVSVKAPPQTAIPWRSLERPGRLAWPLFLPLLAAAGALRLNSGHGAAVALTAIVAAMLLVGWALVKAPQLDKTLLAVILYAAGLAAMWSYSLRGDFVYGFDISAEYYAMHHTLVSGAWYLDHPGDAYGAMLSLTVLPAELHFLSGLPGLLVFKALYPAIGALFPVGVFGLARRILTRRWAFAAAAFILTQAPMLQEYPAVARQEISLVLFAAMVGSMLDTRLPRRCQWTLVALFSIAMTVSHYSTTYLAVGMLGPAVVLQWGLSWFRDLPRVTGAFVIPFAVALAGALTWYGPVTHSASNVSQFVSAVTAQGFSILPHNMSAGSLLNSYLHGGSQTTMPAGQYVKLVHTEYALHKPWVTPLPGAGARQYAVHTAAVPQPPVRLQAAQSAMNLGQLLAQQLANLLAGAGALMMVLRRKTPLLNRQVGLITLGALLLLTVIRLSSTVAAAYNPERALLQALMVLTVCLCWPLQGQKRRASRLQTAIFSLTAAALAAIFIGTSGLGGALLGGGTATNLASSGEDYERYYVTSQELASASWLGRQVQPGQLVYADRYGQLRLIAMTGLERGVLGDVTPMTLDHNAWVYTTRTNLVLGRARTEYGNQLAIYSFPLRFINANYDTVYTNGSSEVFHR